MVSFSTLLDRAAKKNIVPMQKDSIAWFRKNISRMANVTQNSVMRDNKDDLVNSWTNIALGKMYLFAYQPKNKDTLPYYDSSPLIIPIRKYKDRFFCVNLHYLPLGLRAKVLDNLYGTLNNDNLDENTKFQLTYNMIKHMAKFKFFKPCLKMYLGNHVRSRFLLIQPKYWEPVTFLPVASFEKATEAQVWSDSKGKF